MASSFITLWQIEGEKVEEVTNFLFLGSKIIADGNCSHEIRRRLLLEKKPMTNLASVLKAKTSVCNKGLYSQGYGLSSSHVQMWELNHKEGRCFQTVVLEKTFESPLYSKDQTNQSQKKINPEYSLEGLKLKLQYLATWCEQPTHWKRPWCWERLKAEG